MDYMLDDVIEWMLICLSRMMMIWQLYNNTFIFKQIYALFRDNLS